MAQIKTYVLLEHTRPTANVFIQANANQRVRVDTRPVDQPFLQLAFADEEGINRVIRLKFNAKSIYQDEQIKAGVLANEKFTDAERNAVKFINGVLMTGNQTVHAFFDVHPQNAKFKGVCPDVLQPLFEEYDQTIEVKSQNQAFKKRLQVANKINRLSLKEAQDLMIKLNGSFFTPPNTLEQCQNQLVDFLEEANDAAMDDMLRGSVSIDDEATILIGRAIGAKILSFEEVPNFVVRIKNNKSIPIKEISSDHPIEERKRYFLEWLTSDKGSLAFEDLRKEVGLLDNGDEENEDEVKKEAQADVSVIDGKEKTVGKNKKQVA